MWLKRELEQSAGMGAGLDVACGYMQFRPLFKTSTYLGVDLDEGRIAAGLERYPDAQGIVSSIENMQSDVKGDCVTCIQTIGANEFFDPDNTMVCVRKLVDATREKGVLLLTIGPDSAGYCDSIEELLQDCFRHVDVRAYGAFNERVPSFLSKLLAYAMDKLPFLRKGAPPRYLFSCRDKRPVG
jgi:hypothetical protein